MANQEVKKEEKLLEVENLKTYFYHEEGVVKAVDGVSFDIKRGETLGVVGESGCGKSVTSLSVMQLVPQPRGQIEGGKIYYHKDKSGSPIDITALNPRGKEIRNLRGNEMAMIFQEPMTSLNPVYTVGEQIMEAVRLHQGATKNQARERAIEMLDLVGIGSPSQRVDEYPHELSGGMRQRVMIAMALSCNPNLLIADEPTTALDVTIEAQILDLMEDLQDEFNMAIMFITHDLEVIGEMSDRVIVMYTGKIVEKAPIDEIFYNNKHPYTQGLLKSIPQIGVKKRLVPIEGSVPDLKHLPQGCYFAPRCPEAMDKCMQEEPPTFAISDIQQAKCWLYEERKEEVS
ncbi:MAG: ABC transporter ATP-binding protein [Bacillota bacterium]